MCIHTDDEASTELFCGFIKSFSSRRGFGFVSCEETAKRFQRDVYLSKDEAMMLADEPNVGASSCIDSVDVDGNAKKQPVPVQEGDFLLFKVKLSTEGFPQAVGVQKIRRLQGKVLQPASASSDGILIVTADDGHGKENGPAMEDLTGAQVRLRPSACGQLQLVTDDEVSFCCVNSTEADGKALDAQLIELLSTRRLPGAMLGYFSLTLPQAPVEGADSSTAAAVELQGHALTNMIIFPWVPLDVPLSSFTRLFTRLGGAEPVVTRSRAHDPSAHVSIAFSSCEVLAKFLVQASHTVSENGITQLAHVGPAGQMEAHAFEETHSGSGAQSPCHVSPTGGIQFGSFSPTAGVQFGSLGVPEANQPPTGPSVVLATGSMLTSTVPSSSAWRCVHGSIVVPAAPPELSMSRDGACSLCVQWPTVIHASSYVVDIVEMSTMVNQRFMRGQADQPLPALTSMQIDGFRSGNPAACVRCVAPCGCESAPSSWSFLPLGQMMPPAAPTVAAPMVSVQRVCPNASIPPCPPPQNAPLLSTTIPASEAVLEATTCPNQAQAEAECLTLD